MLGIPVPPIHPQLGQGAGGGWAFAVIAIVALVAVVALAFIAWAKGRITVDAHREVVARKELPAAA